MSNVPPSLNRNPWPMKWVALIIVSCIVPYTWMTLHYRKQGPMFQPYQDTKDRAQVLRLLNAGFRRVELQSERPVDPTPPSAHPAVMTTIAGGLPPMLSELLIDRPPVPSGFKTVDAAAAALAGAPYFVSATCAQPNPHEEPTDSVLYLRHEEAVFVIGYAALPGDLQTRQLDAMVRLVVPANTFDPGTYHATLIGARESRRWTFEVH